MRMTLGPAALALALALAPAARGHDRDDVRGPTPVIAFLAVDGVDGESTQKGHEKEIEVLSFGETWRNATSTTGSAGAGAGKPTLSPITITKQQGSASPKLLAALLTGKHLPKVVISFYGQAADGKITVSYRITLQDALVVGMNERSADGRLLDEVQFAFDQAKWEVFDPPDSVTFDGKTNKVNLSAPAGGRSAR